MSVWAVYRIGFLRDELEATFNTEDEAQAYADESAFDEMWRWDSRAEYERCGTRWRVAEEDEECDADAAAA